MTAFSFSREKKRRLPITEIAMVATCLLLIGILAAVNYLLTWGRAQVAFSQPTTYERSILGDTTSAAGGARYSGAAGNSNPLLSIQVEGETSGVLAPTQNQAVTAPLDMGVIPSVGNDKR